MSDEAWPGTPVAPLNQPQWPGIPVDIDSRTGAPAAVRMAVGSASTPEDRLATLRRFAPDARPYQDDNFLFTHPRTGRVTVYNPRGFDMGDVASVAPEAGEALGGIAGGALAAPAAIGGAAVTGGGSLLAVPAGIGLGAAAGRELVTRAGTMLGNTVDTRSVPRQVVDAAGTAAVNAAAVPVGDLVARGVGAMVGPAVRRFAGHSFGQPAAADFANAGVDASAGAVTGNRLTQMVERGLETLPGGTGPIRDLAERQAGQMGQEADRIARQYGTPTNPVEAGRVIQEGAQAAAERFRGRQEHLYDRAFGLVPDNARTPVPRVQALRDEMQREMDLAPESLGGTLGPLIGRLDRLITDAGDNGVPFAALRQIRTNLGRQLDTPVTAASAPDTAAMPYLRRYYEHLTEDMRATPELANPATPWRARALETADRYTRFNATQNVPTLERIAGRDTPEQVFNMIFPASGKPDATALARLRRNLAPEEWNQVAATVIDRMGQPRPGVAAGEEFSPTTFLTNWNRLRQNGDAAYNVLFNGGQNAQLATQLDRLARVSQRLRDVDRLANPSGTARALMAAGAAGAVANDAWSGDANGLARDLFLGAVAPRLAARMLTNPHTVAWLANAAPRLSTDPASIRGLLPRLTAIGVAEPGMREAIDAYSNALRDQLPGWQRRQ